MSEQRVDDELRERFRELRLESVQPGRVPDFGAMLGRAQARAAAQPQLEVVDGSRAWLRRRSVRVGAWASAALAAAVAGVLLTSGSPSGDEDFERLVAAYSTGTSGGGWQSPTSGLLEVPGIELVRSVPSIGSSVGPIGPMGTFDPSSLTRPDAEPNDS